MLFCASLGFAASESREFSAKELTLVDLNTQAGKVVITGMKTDQITFVVDKVKYDSQCRLQFKQSGQRLEVVNERAFLSKAVCEVNFHIIVPKNIDLLIQNGSGPTEVTGTVGALELKIGSGDVDVQSIVEDLKAKMGSGQLMVRGMVGNANVKVGSGDINLVYTQDPGDGFADIKSGSGDAIIYFPAKTQIKSKTLIGSGNVQNDLVETQNAKFLVSFKAGSGSLRIKELL